MIACAMPKRRWWRVLGRVIALLLIVSAGWPARAQSALPPVSYQPALRTIFVGADGPASAPAPITLPEVAAALRAQGYSDLLADQGGGAWLLNAHLVISATAQLEVAAPAVQWLRLASHSAFAATLTVVDGGVTRVLGSRVTSWDPVAATYDTNLADGRSYLLALRGARLDLIDAEAAYLGSAPGEASGVAWRKRRRDSDPTTGATGLVLRSRVHHNYFGLYTYQAYRWEVRQSEVYDNLLYGIDPHDDSLELAIVGNQVYRNGKHGIILSRRCLNSLIAGNTVYSNAAHGIMLDRGSNGNTIQNNTVYDNIDGVVVFQSSNNRIEGNTLRQNARGVRVNASFMPDDDFDEVATGNVIVSNEIRGNREYGIYLYERADRNRITANTIQNNALSGVYIKTGGNIVTANTISANGQGITIVGSDTTLPTGARPPLEAPGQRNSIIGNTIAMNGGVGVRLLGASRNRIGQDPTTPRPEDANTISENGTDGIAIGDYSPSSGGSVTAAVENQIIGNLISANARHGVLVKGATSVGHRISRNRITANGGRGISISEGANRNAQPPVITTVNATTGEIGGTATPGALVEVYRDPDGEGATFLESTTAGADGRWSVRLPAGPSDAGAPTALAILPGGDTSAFSGSAAGVAQYRVLADERGQTTIRVTGAGARVTLPQIREGLGGSRDLIADLGGGVWQLNANLVIERDVTLELSPATGVREVRLRSQRGPIDGGACSGDACRYRSFVYLRTNNGTILIDGVSVRSWDPATNAPDTTLEDGRSYILAKYAATLSIRDAELAYLGYAEGESYGVSWRDINDSAAPGVLRARVTGQVVNSRFHHNYYGVYTFQATGMVFRGNAFYQNVRYGFDPHDFSSEFIVENNEAYENGSHGFIISRGCSNIVFRNNRSYRNADPGASLAHGFMIDPGSPTSADPQVPSRGNILEGNQAYDNEGYGLRLLSAPDTVVRGNLFFRNLQGMTIEAGSSGAVVDGNTLRDNRMYGLFARGGADGALVHANTISGNGLHGLYLKSNDHRVENNTVSGNGGGGIVALPESTTAAALDDLTPPDAPESVGTGDPDLLGTIVAEASLEDLALIGNQISDNRAAGIDLRGTTNARVEGNTVMRNAGHGIYLSDGASASQVIANVVSANQGHGVRANGATTQRNTWSANSIFANGAGGIATTSGAQQGVSRPQIVVARPDVVAGRAQAGAIVEIFSDNGPQGRFFEGRVVASPSGVFEFRPGRAWQGQRLNATATLPDGTSSPFASD